MSRKIDETGNVYGKLTVIEMLPNPNGGKVKCICKCECGNFTEVQTTNLRTANTRSCGCIHKQVNVERLKTHGKTKTPEYTVWRHIKDRCCNPNEASYENYGGRGIKVCDRWLESFENFLEDMGERPSDKHSIDRIDVNGNYCPENCK